VRSKSIFAAFFIGLLCPHASAQWVQTNGPYGGQVNCFAISGRNLFAGTQSGVFLSTSNGTCWTVVNAGLTNTSVQALGVSGTNLFAGTNESGVLRRALSRMTTSVESSTSGLPHEFLLQQNYPNPFNPVTTIRWGSPQESAVQLSIHNLLGQEVATLVNEEQEAGYPETRFDASGLASGMYFYHLS
jgi:hypothetical protein